MCWNISDTIIYIKPNPENTLQSAIEKIKYWYMWNTILQFKMNNGIQIFE